MGLIDVEYAGHHHRAPFLLLDEDGLVRLLAEGVVGDDEWLFDSFGLFENGPAAFSTDEDQLELRYLESGMTEVAQSLPLRILDDELVLHAAGNVVGLYAGDERLVYMRHFGASATAGWSPYHRLLLAERSQFATLLPAPAFATGRILRPSALV